MTEALHRELPIRKADGRTIADVLALEGEVAAREGECRDPNCPEWGTGEVDAFWSHYHVG